MIDVYLLATGRIGNKGPIYEVWSDVDLLCTTWNPEFKTCRILQAHGLTGMVRFWREGKAHWDIQIEIARGAEMTVAENPKFGPRFVKFNPFQTES